MEQIDLPENQIDHEEMALQMYGREFSLVEQEYISAINALKISLEKKSKFEAKPKAKLHFKIGKLYNLIFKSEEAIEHQQEVISHIKKNEKHLENDPDLRKLGAYSYHNLAIAQFRLKKYDEAISSLENSKILFPESFYPDQLLGEIFIAKNDKSRSIQHVLNAIEIFTRNDRNIERFHVFQPEVRLKIRYINLSENNEKKTQFLQELELEGDLDDLLCEKCKKNLPESSCVIYRCGHFLCVDCSTVYFGEKLDFCKLSGCIYCANDI